MAVASKTIVFASLSHLKPGGIPLDIVFVLGTQHDQKRDKQHEIYMAKASPSHWGPNASYIPPASVGGLRWG